MGQSLKFNPPPGWPKPPDGWKPPKGWTPDPEWPDPPPGWQLWLPADADQQATDDEPPNEDGHPEQVSDEIAGDPDSVAELKQRVALLESENAALREQREALANDEDLVILDDEWILQDAGIYRYHHPLENAAAFKERLREISDKISDLIKSKRAITMSSTFTFGGSLAKGKRLAGDLGKLMLRAYNAEVDNSIRSLRAGNIETAKKRVEVSRNKIKKLGRTMEMHISDEFHSLRLEEIELTSDYLMKKQEEKEAAREERARLREERKVQAELAARRQKLDKERDHLLHALNVLRESGKSDDELEKRLAEIDDAIAENDFRAANVRAGYVYVISNRGAFGKGVVKIGLTRRLEPLDRVTELSGAAVPFKFDVHCLFFSEDAVTLESELHEHFADRKLNFANPRKEFFFASPSEVREILTAKVGNLLEFADEVSATEYLQSVRSWPDGWKR